MSEKDTKRTASIAENAVLANEKRGFPFRKIIFALLVVAVVLSIFLLILNIVINSYFGKITVFDGKWEINAEKVENTPRYKDNAAYYMAKEEWHVAYDAALLNYAQATSDVMYDDTVYNYAIFGTDQFDGSGKTAGADIIMLVSVDEDDDHVTYLSFETRMLVYIPGVGVGPLNDAYDLGGPQLLTNTIEQNFGIQLDGFVELNMSAFTELIDEFGDFEVKGDAALVEKINADIVAFNAAKGLSGEEAVQPVKLENGMIKLAGQQALAYMRNAGEDKAAIANEVLTQVTSKIYEGGFGGIKSTLDIALEKMTVSMVREDVGALLSIGFSVFESVKTVPVGNMEGRETINGVGVVCDYQAEREAVIEALYK